MIVESAIKSQMIYGKPSQGFQGERQTEAVCPCHARLPKVEHTCMRITACD